MFLLYNFHLSLAVLNFLSGDERIFRFLLFELVLCFSPTFSGVFLNVICYSKRMRILWYNVFGFVLSSEVKKLTRFCRRLPRCKEKNFSRFL